MKSILIFFSLTLIPILGISNHFYYNIPSEIKYLGKGISILEDPTNQLDIHQVKAATTFKDYTKDIINYGVCSNAIWLKFKITNTTDEQLMLKISKPIIDEITYYAFLPDTIHIVKTGTNLPYNSREFDSPNFIFNLNLKKIRLVNFSLE